MSRPLTEQDKRTHPNEDLRENVIGYDGLAIVVSQPVYEGGVTTLTKAQIRSLYEGKVKNWKDVGGPDARIVFFNKEPGRGTWEVFAQFVYGKAELAPKVFHPEVGANQEALTKVSQHKSAVTQLSASWAAVAKNIRVVGIRKEDGKVSLPTREEIEKETYPLRRPLVLVTRGAPRGDVAKLVSFFDTTEGRSIVEKAGFLSKVGALAKAGR
jgi:phosphate transport system substrate-binding protein